MTSVTTTLKNSAKQNTHLKWDENGQPISKEFDDVYFSSSNGLEETRYVFIENNNLEERFVNLDKNQHFTIGETGFGTGLNFLATWQLFRKIHTNNTEAPRLHFITVEKYPLTIEDLGASLELWPELNKLKCELIRCYPPQPASGVHRLIFDKGQVTLTLFFGEAEEALSSFNPLPNISNENTSNNTEVECFTTSHSYTSMPLVVDAWFLDGFAPAKNPDMWTTEIFKQIASLSRPHTTFATFTAAGLVRRTLESLNFDCQKSPGFGHKREMLKGTYLGHLSPSYTIPTKTYSRLPSSNSTYWHLSKCDVSARAPTTAIVIGGGISGCQTAFALAKRGIKVTLLEQHNHLATQASGNKQGVVYTKLSPHQEPLSQFNLSAQLFADTFYQEHGFYQKCGDACGVFHQATSDRQKQLFNELANTYNNDQRFCQWLNEQEATKITRVKQHTPGLFLPSSGWLNPVSLCHALTEHTNIKIIHSSKVDQLIRTENQWLAFDEYGNTLAKAEVAIIANAEDAKNILANKQLPLKRIRGQVTYFTLTEKVLSPNTVLCGDGYIAPPVGEQFTTGATFTLNKHNECATNSEHRQNLNNLIKMIPEYKQAIAKIAVENLEGKVGFRCTTPDYFPIVGPVPDEKTMIDKFRRYRKKANANIIKAGAYLPQLYCNLGQGSRGLAYTPIASDLLASMICGEPLPLSRQLTLHLHPARFLIRNLMRNKI